MNFFININNINIVWFYLQKQVVFFGEGEEDILFLHNDILKESYVKSNFPGFSENGSEPQILKVKKNNF